MLVVTHLEGHTPFKILTALLKIGLILTQGHTSTLFNKYNNYIMLWLWENKVIVEMDWGFMLLNSI